MRCSLLRPLGILLWASAACAATLEYALGPPSSCVVYVSPAQPGAPAAAPSGPDVLANQTYSTTLELQVSWTGSSEVSVPWQLALHNPGYVRVVHVVALHVMTPAQGGTITLQALDPVQTLHRSGRSPVNVTMTLEVDSQTTRPFDAFLNGSPCSLQGSSDRATQPVTSVSQPYAPAPVGAQELPSGLTTFQGQIIGPDGLPVDLKGVSWFGFDDTNHYLDGLWEPEQLGILYTGMSQELQTVVQRLQLLGFNAVRLPFSFDLFSALPASNYTRQPCVHPPLLDVLQATTPPDLNRTVTSEDLERLATASLESSPPLEPGVCNANLPDTSLAGFLYVADLFARNGFTVVVALQSLADTVERVRSDQLVKDWVDLVTLLSEDPITRMRLAIDVLNEPDQFNMGWTFNATSQLPGYGDILTAVLDALWPINPYALYFVQGTGQKPAGVVDDWGDGLITDPAILRAHPLASDPNPFFRTLLTKPYLNQMVIAPHVYPPSISEVENGTITFGASLFLRLSASFGHLNFGKGYCAGDTCHQFALAIGETGSGLASDGDIEFMLDLASYMHNIGDAEDGRHNRIGSWFWWAWNANAQLDLGLCEADWQTIKWESIEYLQYLGLQPWYAQPTEGQQATDGQGAIRDVGLEPVPIITLPSPPPPTACPDVPPDASYTCAQQAFFGKCDDAFLVQGQFCAATCNRCAGYIYPAPPPPGQACVDLEPGGPYTCAQQALFGKCQADFIVAGGFCQASCQSCPGEIPAPPPPCSDDSPDGYTPCPQEKRYGKCGEPWMIAGPPGGTKPYCDFTCFNCSASLLASQGPSGAAASGPGPAAAESLFKIDVYPSTLLDTAPTAQGAPALPGGR